MTFQPFVRAFRRQPWVWVLSAIMLSLGLGATVAVVSVLDRVLLNPLPVRDVARVMELTTRTKNGEGSLPYGAFCAERDQNTSFEYLSWAEEKKFAFRVGSEPAHLVSGAFLSESYFETMGLHPMLGRSFTRQEEDGPSDSVILGSFLWRRRFHSDPTVLGKLVYLNGHPCTVVGIGPSGFTGLLPGVEEEVWFPLAAPEALGGKARVERLSEEFSRPGRTLGRLKPGSSPSQAQVAAETIGRVYLESLSAEGREFQGLHESKPLDINRKEVLAAQLPRSWLLLGASLCLLLLACANVANLRLAEGLRRQREYALKLALGATPYALFRSVLMEGLVLAVPSCLFGLLLARPILDILLQVQSAGFYASPMVIPLSARTVIFTALLATASTLMSGLLPAWQASRMNAIDLLKNGGRATQRKGLQEGLVALQVGLSLILVAGSFGAAHSLRRFMNTDPGFRAQGIACVRVDLGAYSNDPERLESLIQALRQRALELPGVTEAAFAAAPPMEPEVAIMTRYRSPQGAVSLPGSIAGSGFFHLLGISVLEGNEFQDPAPEKGEVVINEALAKKLWPGERAEGRMYGPWPVRGVVKDFAMFPGKGLHEPVVFLRKRGWARLPFLTLLVRTSHAPESLLPALRALPPSVALDAVVVRADSLRQHLAALQRPLQIALWLFGGCGVASLIIASIGLGSLINLRVTQSRREFGLRLVLGATSSSLVLRTTQQGLLYASLGLGAGLIGILALQRLLTIWSDSLKLTEPYTLFAAATVMLLVSGLASLLPALQVVRVNPGSLLKEE